MTLNELKEKIVESPNKDWFQSRTLLLNYPQINFELTLKGIVAVYEFVLRQIEGFENLQNLPPEFEVVKNTFINVRDRIISLITNNPIADNLWDNNLNILSRNNPLMFLYDSPETDFLIRVNKENPNYYSGAYEYLTGNIQHASNKNYFSGYILAYEFKSKDFSLLAERKESEKKSIARIRSDFQKTLGESETHITDYLFQTNQKYIDYSKEIDRFKDLKETLYNNWFGQASSDFSQFHVESNKKITELEILYREKLKLEAPAKYWSKRAKRLRREGNGWLAGLMSIIGIAVYLLIWCINEISIGTLEKIFQNNGTAIKWSVVFITFISFLAFAIKVFSKLTFSSFHLVRDAEEREQLTYVYLALKNEKGIDETERHLVMQSLFSRADTGLLKDDASPTMPGNIVDQIIKK